MNSKHHNVPWYGASEELQAKLTLAAMTTPTPTEVSVTQQEILIPATPTSASQEPTFTPKPFASFTASLPLPTPKPLEEEPPLEDTLVYEEDVDPSSSDMSPEMEQSLLDPPQEKETEKPKQPTPSEEDIKEAALFSPSDLHQYNYTINCRSGIIIRYPKKPDSTKPLAVSMIQQDVTPPEAEAEGEVPPQKKQKVSSVKVWSKKDSGCTLLYRPPKSDDDGPPSMV